VVFRWAEDQQKVSVAQGSTQGGDRHVSTEQLKFGFVGHEDTVVVCTTRTIVWFSVQTPVLSHHALTCRKILDMAATGIKDLIRR
jgi:hypothetical protein